MKDGFNEKRREAVARILEKDLKWKKAVYYDEDVYGNCAYYYDEADPENTKMQVALTPTFHVDSVQPMMFWPGEGLKKHGIPMDLTKHPAEVVLEE
jgi:hypothetical protein